jgi:hypothetical protein
MPEPPPDFLEASKAAAPADGGAPAYAADQASQSGQPVVAASSGNRDQSFQAPQAQEPPRGPEVDRPAPAASVWLAADPVPQSAAAGCAHCGEPLPGGAAYCANCGRKVVGPEAAKQQLSSAVIQMITDGGQVGETYKIADNGIRIGRVEGDIVFAHDGYMSSNHAKVVERDGRFFLVDQNSRNGTFIKIREEIELKSGDTFLVGKQVFRFDKK